MEGYKYTLEKYQGMKTKHHCPQCNKKTFTKYIDTETGEYLGETVGRCDRESKCGYHEKPNGTNKVVFSTSLPSLASLKVYLPLEILQKSRVGYTRNTFVQHLNSLFDQETVAKLITSYHLGTSGSRWEGACVFWFIDIKGRIHAGQVKLFKDGHTLKEDGRSCTTWVHSLIKEPWIKEYRDQEKKVSCLFGEHLIKDKPIAVVEAPATAIVASAYLPMYTWVACGGLSFLTAQRCEVLKGKKVVLFPDLNAYDKWKQKADEFGFYCSDLLEKNASDEDKAKGLDLRDYLEQFSIIEFTEKEYDMGGTLIDHRKGYPISWDLERATTKYPMVRELINRLDLIQIK